MNSIRNRPLLRVLLIENDQSDAARVQDLLRESRVFDAETEWFSDSTRAFAAALEHRHDVILTGTEMIRKFAENGGQTPTILLLSENREDLDIEALRHGASDCLFKNEINARHLERSIRYAIERKHAAKFLRKNDERFRTTEQLAEARDQALEHVRLKSQFLANMTHEIRTPMNGILGMTGLLQQTDLTEEQRELTESVRSSGQALVRIIDDILDFSRLEAGKLQIEQMPFNLLAVAEDVTDLLAESVRGRGIEFISFVEPNIPLALLGDAGRLRQVLLNLAGNAVKFTHEGEVRMKMTLLQEDAREIRIKIEIQDTGIGMSRETQEKLFTAFMQADGSTTRHYGGTGLGLAISKEIVGLMGGDIRVKSEFGRGSVFSVRLRFQKDPEGDFFLTRGKPEWKNRRILVIDDNARQRAFLCRHFSWLGFDCTELSHTAKAPHILAHEARHGKPFAAVFVGADFSVEQARQTVAHVAAFPGSDKTRVVAMPFDALNEDLQPLREAGAEFFLPKPVRQSQLYSLFEAIFSAHDAVDETESDQGAADSLKRYRFLIVSNREGNADALEQLLHYLGSSADLATTGTKAIQSLNLFHYDAVFLDHAMERDDPARLLAKIRALPIGGNIRKMPVIGIGNGNWPATIPSLGEPFDATDVINILRACRLLDTQDRDSGTGTGTTPSAPSFTDTLDVRRLREILRLENDGESVMTDLLALFRQEVPRRVRELQTAIETRQHRSVGFLIHAIRGVCSNLGAKRMDELCGRLENRMMSGDSEGAQRALDAIARETEAIELALQKGDLSELRKQR